jgi:hypothetical protein
MSLFDGMSGILTEVFGDSAIYMPKGGVARTVKAVCRSSPIEVLDGDGHAVLILSPTMRVGRDVAPELARGDQVIPDGPASMSGKSYEVINMLPTASSADDGFLMAELELVED